MKRKSMKVPEKLLVEQKNRLCTSKNITPNQMSFPLIYALLFLSNKPTF